MLNILFAKYQPSRYYDWYGKAPNENFFKNFFKKKILNIAQRVHLAVFRDYLGTTLHNRLLYRVFIKQLYSFNSFQIYEDNFFFLKK